MSVPDLDPEQRRKARQKAVRVRRVRAELKQMVKTGEMTLADVLTRGDHDEAVAGMRVVDLLRAMPNYGKVRARELMDQLDIAPSRRLRGLGSRQRTRLLEAVGEHPPR